MEESIPSNAKAFGGDDYPLIEPHQYTVIQACYLDRYCFKTRWTNKM